MNKSNKNAENSTANELNICLSELTGAILNKKFIVFCGAGISIDSGIPLANNLVRYILQKLNITQEETEIIMNAGLPFEAFIQNLSSASNIYNLFDIFDAQEPNTNHILLAKLAKAGYLKTILTTNFDQLIEKAFDREGLKRENDYLVLFKDNDFNISNYQENRITIFKIHGSLENKKEMAITLKQVANRSHLAKRQGLIEHVFSTGTHNDILIMGYSCSDAFDISPQIEAIEKNDKNVFFIDHFSVAENENKAQESKVEHIAIKKSKNPFKKYKGSKRIFIDTNILVNKIWKLCVNEELILLKRIKDCSTWKKQVDHWYTEAEDKYSKAVKFNIIAGVFLDISEYQKAVIYYHKALNKVKENGMKDGYGFTIGNLGVAYRRLGNFKKAIEFSKQDIQIAKKIGDRDGQAASLGNLGVCPFYIGQLEKACEYNEQSLSLAIETGNKHWQTIALGDLGNIYAKQGEHDQAIKYYKQALQIAEEIGDIKGYGNQLSNLGVVYRENKNLEELIKCYQQGLKIAIKIGDIDGQLVDLTNLGLAHHISGDLRDAEKYYKESIKLAIKTGNKEKEGCLFGFIGVLYKDLCDYERAIENSNKALIIMSTYEKDDSAIKMIKKNLDFSINKLAGRESSMGRP